MAPTKRLRVQTVQLTPTVAQTATPIEEVEPPKPTPPKKKKAPPPKKTTKKQPPPKKPSKPDNSKLLAEALSHLDRSTSKQKTPSKEKPSQVHAISSLNTDSSLIDKTKEKPSAESSYIADLIRRLQVGIKLPEHGEASVAITINRSGKPVKVVVTESTSASIKQTLSQKLPNLTFSPFGGCFSNEQEHIFLLRLSNDLVWSS